MKKRLNRYPIKLTKIYFRKGKHIVAKNFTLFLKKYDVHGIIQILQTDFKFIKKNINRFTHFNIQYTGHKSGKKYLIVKIDRLGYFDGVSYKHPAISSKNFILAKCLLTQNNVDYADLKDNVFKHSIRNIKNVSALKKAIKRRYRKTLTHLSDEEKLSLGVAITELKIIKRF